QRQQAVGEVEAAVPAGGGRAVEGGRGGGVVPPGRELGIRGRFQRRRHQSERPTGGGQGGGPAGQRRSPAILAHHDPGHRGRHQQRRVVDPGRQREDGPELRERGLVVPPQQRRDAHHLPVGEGGGGRGPGR